MTKISLHGFNNLTKNLSFSLYNIHFLNSENSKHLYKAYINKTFCADHLITILSKICHSIGGNILNIAKQDYEPQGASATLMISEESKPDSIVAHIDKSHLCIHTYPEEAPQDGVAIFRVDIDLSTCGLISPLTVLNDIISEFDADVAHIDYRIRGMTRNYKGEKLFIDENLSNISDHLSKKSLNDYQYINHNLAAHNLFLTKIAKKDVLLESYLFNSIENKLTKLEQQQIITTLQSEIKQLFQKS